MVSRHSHGGGTMQAQQSGNPAVRNGLIFGVIIAAVTILDDIIQWVTGSYNATVQAANNPGTTTSINGASTLLGCLVFLIALALCFIAGMNTARATGRVGSGAIAGLVAGLVGALIGGIIGLIIVAVVVAPGIHVQTTNGVSVQAILIGGAIFAIVLGLIIDGGLGAGLGALVGKNNYRGPVTNYQESMYQGFAGQPPAPPQYPGQPGAYPPPPQYPTQPGSYPPPPPNPGQ